MPRIDLDTQTFEMTAKLGFEDLRIIRDGLQHVINDAKTSPEGGLPERLAAIQNAADAMGLYENLDWSAE